MSTVAWFLGVFIALAINTYLNTRTRIREYEYYDMVCRELIEINKKQNELLEELEHDNKLLKDQLDAKSSDCIHCPYVPSVRTGGDDWSDPYPKGTH